MNDPIDVYVGARVRAARLAAGLSQTTLAGMLGVAYQQLQKYENASNRISCSRIVKIAAALGRPVEWFFEGASLGPGTAGSRPNRTWSAAMIRTVFLVMIGVVIGNALTWMAMAQDSRSPLREFGQYLTTPGGIQLLGQRCAEMEQKR